MEYKRLSENYHNCHNTTPTTVNICYVFSDVFNSWQTSYLLTHYIMILNQMWDVLGIGNDGDLNIQTTTLWYANKQLTRNQSKRMLSDFIKKKH